MKNYKLTLAIIISLTAILAFSWQFDDRYVNAEEFKNFKQESRSTSLEIQRSQLLSQKLAFQLQYPENNRPQLVKNEIARLGGEIKKIDLKLEILYKGD